MSRGEEYYIHRITDKTCRISKAIHGEIKADSVYEVTNTSCQCYQALHRGECRHMKMRRSWINAGFAPKSVIYDFDKGQITVMPEE